MIRASTALGAALLLLTGCVPNDSFMAVRGRIVTREKAAVGPTFAVEQCKVYAITKRGRVFSECLARTSGTFECKAQVSPYKSRELRIRVVCPGMAAFESMAFRTPFYVDLGEIELLQEDAPLEEEQGGASGRSR